MNVIIFYSWQSNTDAQFNKSLIADCIQAAIKMIENKGQLKGVKFYYQESTSNLSGTVDIIPTIEERLNKCDIMIADLSVTNAFPWILKALADNPSLEYRFLQNSNVIIEHSRALAQEGGIEVISVMNSSYGDPNLNDKVLPFDLRGKRFPFTYKCSSEVEIDNAKKQLISYLENSLRSSTLSLMQRRRYKYLPFMSFIEHKNEFKTKSIYCYNENLTNAQSVILEDNENIRILGLSGIGKTRLVFEAVKKDESLRIRYLYCDCFTENFDDIKKKVESICIEKDDVFLVLDNCDYINAETILRLKKRHNSDKVRVVTIWNQEEVDRLQGYSYIDLNSGLHSVIDQIIEENGTGISGENKALIKEFSDGIPLMTILLIESIRNGEQNIGKLTSKDFVRKLVVEENEEREILKSCSIFRYLGFSEDLEDQIKLIVTNTVFTPISGDANIKSALFERVFNKFKRREIIEINGRTFSIRPRPLALALADEWFNDCSKERLLEVINLIQDPQNTHNYSLTEALSKQIVYLGDNEKVKLLISSLTTHNGPFYNAKVLNTELGPRLFRSFVEVNPEAIADCLYRLFSDQSTEELRLIKEGRRNLIWTLEKVCFDKRTFIRGAKVLMAFSVAENEKLANNATGVFLQLFRIILPGTQADLSDRLNIVKWGLEKENKEFNKIAQEAINSAFKSESFSYLNGADKQGSKTLEHYYPSSSEIHEYWNSLLDIINEQIISSDSDISMRASEILTTRLRHLVNLRATEKLLEILARVIEFKKNDWDELLDPLYDLINYENENLSDGQLERIQDYITNLTKNDFLSRFKEIDKQRRRKYRDLSFEESLNIRRQEYSRLAEEFLELDHKNEILKTIFEDKDIFPVGFGGKLANLVEGNPKLAEWFVDASISIFKSSETKYNTFIFLEFCQNLTENQFETLIQRLRKEDNISTLLFPLLAKRNITFDKIGVLIDLINSGKATVKHFIFFFDSSIITPDKDCEIYELLNQLQEYGQDGRDVILQVAYRNIFPFISVEEGSPLVLNLVLEILSTTSFKDLNSEDVVCKLSAKILSQSTYPDFAKHVIQELIKLAETFDMMFLFDYQIENLFRLLIENYFEIIWPKLSQALLSENDKYIVFHNLKNLLGSLNGSYGKSGLLFWNERNNSEIIEWAKRNPKLAPERLASMIPMFQGKGFSPIALALLDNFGHDNGMLSAFNANMGSFSWVGSTIPFYENRIEVLKTLLSHNNKNVVSWAAQQIEYTKKDLEREKNREDEEKLYYRA